MSQAPNDAKTSPPNWLLHLWSEEMDADHVQLSIGHPNEESGLQPWAIWERGDSDDIPVPRPFADAKSLWIKAEAQPENCNVYMCLRRDGHVVKHMEFNGSFEFECEEGDRDHCAC